MADAILMPLAKRSRGRRRVHPIDGVKLAPVVSLPPRRERTADERLSELQPLTRDLAYHLLQAILAARKINALAAD
ncbi:TPA: hypothetical protein QDC27_002058 [Burkholderia cepacia ATCC 25416]|uniref:hypothetical protein n=1 Tax=Burkholderia pseudomallei TaxID=28450 RepID=UPI0005377755|nr:hypothetical protein [Burkholderia pseudomallei]HDR9767120.1 hypothetical protein [Burkholderia cepacia ATCC 25416]KGW12306.1 hypothetical protein X882_4657 [Burkholderia pseudomallei MSHR4303]HDR9774291.1 hypothetical protein [Burkholderia cepacia ATCC 25416]HDR9780714.1 hypothetical protein [Burkholderia cepacia ATCC 25416]HDR9788578.1 hypothetical protein [Burkholderia cepacia ATCC 25416]